MHVPHVLVQGAINIEGVARIRWDETIGFDDSAIAG